MAKKDDDTQKLPAITVKEGSVLLPSQVNENGGVTVTTGSSNQTETMLPTFADKLESLMNEAVHASVPPPNQQATEHHQRFAHWANHLGDLWREVKQHAK